MNVTEPVLHPLFSNCEFHLESVNAEISKTSVLIPYNFNMDTTLRTGRIRHKLIKIEIA
jgi:hypothetical protein